MFSLRTPFCRDAVIQAHPFCRENLVSLYNLRGHDPTRVISRGIYIYIHVHGYWYGYEYLLYRYVTIISLYLYGNVKASKSLKKCRIKSTSKNPMTVKDVQLTQGGLDLEVIMPRDARVNSCGLNGSEDMWRVRQKVWLNELQKPLWHPKP